MIHDSYLFDFQVIINKLRDKIKKDEKLEKNLKPVLDAITEDTELEDLPMYKEYLSAFDVEHDLGELKLHCPSEIDEEECKGDFLTLLRFVAASFSSTYNLEYNEKTNSVDLLVTVVGEDITITKEVHKLWMFQIVQLFEIYMEEMLNFEALRLMYEGERISIDEERKMRVLVYQKKMRQLKNKKKISEITSNMDDLLNS